MSLNVVHFYFVEQRFECPSDARRDLSQIWKEPVSLIPDFSWKMSEDYSVFDYEGDDSNAVTKKTRRPQNRARAWTREDIWRCCHERLGAETFEERKINAKNEIKARSLLMMGDVLLPQIHFIFIVLNCESLEHPKEDYEIPVRCYVQSKQISKFLLDSNF